jgi:hypothetical protein
MTSFYLLRRSEVLAAVAFHVRGGGARYVPHLKGFLYDDNMSFKAYVSFAYMYQERTFLGGLVK